MTRRTAGWRIAVRIARRELRRSRVRSLLVAGLVGLPVLAASTVDVVYRSDQLEPADRAAVSLGAYAQAEITVPGFAGEIAQTPDAASWLPATDTSASQLPPLTEDQARARLAAHLPPRDRLIRDLTWSPRLWLRFGDRALPVGIRELDPADPGLTGLLAQVEGRAPQAPGEVQLTTTAARTYGIRVGDRLDLPAGAIAPGSPARSLGVVGLVRPSQGSWNDVVGRPGDLVPPATAAADARTASWYVVGPDPVGWDQVQALNTFGDLVLSRSVLRDPPPPDRVAYSTIQARRGISDASTSGDRVGILVVAVGLVLLQVALMAGPALAVGARRNRRALALIAATGAERRQLRAVVLANGLLLGLAGTLAGAGVGTALGAWLVGWLHDRGSTDAPRVDLHPADLAGLVALGTLTALAAAAVPARQAAAQDVVATLNGRRAQAPPQLRVPVVGLLVAVGGAALALWSAAVHSSFRVVLGIAIGEIGLVMAVGAVVSLAARLARRLPVAPRVALRDAARHRGRTAPAVAAVMAALAGATAAVLYLGAQDDAGRRFYQPRLLTGGVQVDANGPADLFGPQTVTRIRDRLHQLLPVRTVATLLSPEGPHGQGLSFEVLDPPGRRCAVTGPGAGSGIPVVRPVGDSCPFDQPGRLALPRGPLVDDGTAVAALGGGDPGTEAALSAGKVVVYDRGQLWPDGTVHLAVVTLSADGSSESGRRTVALPGYASTARVMAAPVVVPTARVAALGAAVTRVTGLVASTTRMPSAEEEQRAAAALQDLTPAGSVILTVERGYVPRNRVGLLTLVLAAVVVALAGTFTAVGLSAAEGRADIATLAAIGAAPGVRRRLAAAQAGVIAALGTVLGLAGGLLAGVALVRLMQPGISLADAGWFGQPPESSPTGWRLVFPWAQLAGLTVGVPVLALVTGFLATRSRLPLVRRIAQ